MNIQTKFHGEVSLKGATRYTFPQGIPGFEEETEWTILPINDNNVFQVFQSTNTPEVAFVVANPYTLIENYELVIDEATQEALDITSEEDVFVLTVITVKEPFNESTMNLQAPLIFNVESKKGKQMITNDESYSTREPIERTKEEN